MRRFYVCFISFRLTGAATDMHVRDNNDDSPRIALLEARGASAGAVAFLFA